MRCEPVYNSEAVRYFGSLSLDEQLLIGHLALMETVRGHLSDAAACFFERQGDHLRAAVPATKQALLPGLIVIYRQLMEDRFR